MSVHDLPPAHRVSRALLGLAIVGVIALGVAVFAGSDRPGDLWRGAVGFAAWVRSRW